MNFTYEVTRVDEDNKVMDLVFKTEGLSDVLVSARLPFNGESVDDLALSVAPFYAWDMEQAEFTTPSVGVRGSLVIAEGIEEELVNITDIAEAKELKIKEVNEWRKSTLKTPFAVNGNLVAPDQRTMNTLRSIKDNIDNGIYTEVNFLLEDNQYTTITAENVDSYISQVAIKMQSIFDDESTKIKYVNSLTSIDEVIAYNPSLIPSVKL